MARSSRGALTIFEGLAEGSFRIQSKSAPHEALHVFVRCRRSRCNRAPCRRRRRRPRGRTLRHVHRRRPGAARALHPMAQGRARVHRPDAGPARQGLPRDGRPRERLRRQQHRLGQHGSSAGDAGSLSSRDRRQHRHRLAEHVVRCARQRVGNRSGAAELPAVGRGYRKDRRRGLRSHRVRRFAAFRRRAQSRPHHQRVARNDARHGLPPRFGADLFRTNQSLSGERLDPRRAAVGHERAARRARYRARLAQRADGRRVQLRAAAARRRIHSRASPTIASGSTTTSI